MKRKIIMLAVYMATVLSAWAENTVTVSDVEVPQGGTGTIAIDLNNDEDITAFSMFLELPTDISYNSFEKGTRYSDHTVAQGSKEGKTTFGCLSLTSAPIAGTSGTLLYVKVSADASLAIGTKLTATLSQITLSTPDAKERNLDDVVVNITITEKRTLLDETSTTAPEEETNANVRVKRTIKAGEWSTLVLPFAMNETQVKTAFGDDVELMDFTGWASEEDDDANITSITVSFSSISSIAANHPCLILVSSDVYEFTADNVDICPEEEPCITVGTKKVEKGFFTGTYVANTVVPQYNLFLSGNKFWYSTGNTKMKAFRAFFEFYDVLTEVAETYAPIRFSFEENTTAITNMEVQPKAKGVYTVNGMQLNYSMDVKSLPKGLYIVDGKKVSVK